MKYLKTFEARKKIINPKYYDFEPDIVYKNLRDTDYWWEKISNTKYDNYSLEHLFKLACEYVPKLAVKMVDILSPEQIVKNDEHIDKLPLNEFKQLLTKNELYKKLINVDVHASDDDAIQKLKFIKTIEPETNFSDKLLISATWYRKLDLIKYLVSTGLNPAKLIKNISDINNNCLDTITNHYNVGGDDKINTKIIKYFVEDLNIAVTPRHIFNIIDTKNLKALKILINAKNTTGDYAYCGWSQYNKSPYQICDVIKKMTGRDINIELIKTLLKNQYNFGYDKLQCFSKKDNNINPKNLELAYWVISNFNGHENSYTTNYIININNINFWLKK